MEKLLTLEEVCSILGCNDPKGRYVRNLRDQGLLRAAKFGRRLMFTESSVESFIENQFALQNKKRRPDQRRLGDEVKTTQLLNNYITERKNNGEH